MAEPKAKSEEVKKKVGNAYVTSTFRDKDNFDIIYEVDQDVSDLSPERIAELEGKGLVETHKKEEEQKPA